MNYGYYPPGTPGMGTPGMGAPAYPGPGMETGYGMPGPQPPMQPGMAQCDQLENRLLRLEQEVKRLEARVARLETPYQTTPMTQPYQTSTAPEITEITYPSNVYMM